MSIAQQNATETWQRIRDEFHECTQKCPGLTAQWREAYHVWVLVPALMSPSAGDFASGAITFKAASLKAIEKLRKKSQFREPWQLWLDLLRHYAQSQEASSAAGPSRYVSCGVPLYVSIKEWHELQKTGESLHLVRKRLGYTTNKEFGGDGDHLRHPDGLLALDGIIASAAEASADFCQNLELAEAGSDAIRRQTFMAPHISPTPRKPTLNALAEKIGVAQSSLSRWHRGETGLASISIERLAEYLGVEPTSIPN